MKATIRDIATTAEVSTATVDRVLNGRSGVKATNRYKVLNAAAKLGYLPETGDLTLPAKPARLEFFLPVASNRFLEHLADQIEDYCLRLPLVSSCKVTKLADAAPSTLLSALDELDLETAGVGIVAVDDPNSRAAIQRLVEAGVRVVTIASDLPSSLRANYVGVDNRVAGRTAAKLMGSMVAQKNAKIALFLGSRRYRGHDEREAGFRSVLSEDFPHLLITETVEIDDNAELGYQRAVSILARDPDLAGIYVAGGGRSGVIRAVGEKADGPRPVLFCHDLTEQTRKYLLNDTVSVVIDQNARLLAEQATIQLLGSLVSSAPYLTKKFIEPRVITRENIPAT